MVVVVVVVVVVVAVQHHLCLQGVLRTSAVAYDAADPTNRFAHLTNHCIATEHDDYGKFEATNEISNPNPSPNPSPNPNPNT